MVDILLVDWLGRGGIAQVSESWRRTAVDAGLDVHVVSRVSETVEVDTAVRKRLPAVPGALDAHLRLVRAMAEAVRRFEPPVVYLQNYFLPFAEERAVRVARRAGSRVVLAVHNHRPHQLRSGSSLGLARLLGAVDDLVTHSEFERRGLREAYGRDSAFVPHPTQAGLLATSPMLVQEVAERLDGRRVAVRFGVLARGYKGGDALAGLDRMVGDDWLVVAAGVGASGVQGAEVIVDRFLTEGELHWLLGQADVSLLPYRNATQSGAVVLAQLLGAPPIASDVGGIAEQIAEGEDGLLVPAGAHVSEWASRLRRISEDPQWWRDIARRSVDRSRQRDERARTRWLDVVRPAGRGGD